MFHWAIEKITWPKYLNSVTNWNCLPSALKHGKLLHTILDLSLIWVNMSSVFGRTFTVNILLFIYCVGAAVIKE